MAETRVVNGVTYTRVPGGWQKAGPPRDPTFVYKGPKAAADLGKTEEEIRQMRRQTALDERKEDRGARQYPISKEDAAIIDRYRKQADVARRAQIELRQSATASDRFNPGPDRARNVSRSITQPEDSLPMQWGRKAYGSVAGVSDQDREDYINLDRYRQARVASIQQEQTGSQTESDALRYMKGTFGPEKSRRINADAIGEAMFSAKMDELRPGLYTDWANRHGSLSAKNKRGQTVDQWFSSIAEEGWRRYTAERKKAGGGKVNRSTRAVSPSEIIDLEDY